MNQDELAIMDGGKCILQLRGVRPFLADKYDITKHPRYRELSHYDPRNAFDITKYRSRKLIVKPEVVNLMEGYGNDNPGVNAQGA